MTVFASVGHAAFRDAAGTPDNGQINKRRSRDKGAPVPPVPGRRALRSNAQGTLSHRCPESENGSWETNLRPREAHFRDAVLLGGRENGRPAPWGDLGAGRSAVTPYLDSVKRDSRAFLPKSCGPSVVL